MATDRQRAGLALGPGTRSRRAALRAAIAAGTVSIVDLLEGRVPDIEGDAMGMRIDTLMQAIPGVGEEMAAAILRRASVFAHKRLGELTIQQRAAIVAAFTEETP